MEKPRPIRLVIVHSHSMLRDGLRRLLEAEPEHMVIGAASDGAEAVRLVRQLKPDILLLYPRLPKHSGWDALRELSGELRTNATSVRVILLAAEIDTSEMVEALQLGVRGIVFLVSATQVLLKAIQTVMAGEYWVRHESFSNLAAYLRTLMQSTHEEVLQKKFSLTPREL